MVRILKRHSLGVIPLGTSKVAHLRLSNPRQKSPYSLENRNNNPKFAPPIKLEDVKLNKFSSLMPASFFLFCSSKIQRGPHTTYRMPDRCCQNHCWSRAYPQERSCCKSDYNTRNLPRLCIQAESWTGEYDTLASRIHGKGVFSQHNIRYHHSGSKDCLELWHRWTRFSYLSILPDVRTHKQACDTW